MYDLLDLFESHPWLASMACGFIISEIQALNKKTIANGIIHWFLLKVIEFSEDIRKGISTYK
jgi:hypothetical protein